MSAHHAKSQKKATKNNFESEKHLEINGGFIYLHNQIQD